MRTRSMTLALAALLGPLLAACGPAADAPEAADPADAVVAEAPPADDMGAYPADAEDVAEEAPAPEIDPASLPPVPDAVADAFGDADDPFVSVAELEAALDAGMDIQFVDARPPLDYEFGHIPGAINVEYSTADQFDTSVLPTDRWMVAYCECPHAEAQQVYDALRAKGVGNIKVLDEGLAGWRDVLGRPLETSPSTTEG